LRVALINTNRYLEPPVIPLAIEYLAHYLDREGHEIKVIDLAFSERPEDMLRNELGSFDPHLAGFTIRNTDTCLYPDSVFFLDEAADIMSACRDVCDAKLVIGGSALHAGPAEVAEYVDCDCAVVGPGEKALPLLLELLANGAALPRLFNGWSTGLDASEVPVRGRWLDYSPYLEERGVAGFESQLGCLGKCSFCIEAGLPWKPRHPDAVVEELRRLAELGCRDLHLCDCEFNQDIEFCKSLLRRIASADLDIEWSPYMKVLPYDAELFRLIAEAGVRTITLSIDSQSLASGEYDLPAVAGFIREARANGIKLAADVLLGFPREELEELKGIIDFFKRERPDTVGVHSWIRLFKYSAIGREIMTKPPGKGRIEGSDPDYLQPVFYNWLDNGACESLIDGDPLFRIEGMERFSNYERLK